MKIKSISTKILLTFLGSILIGMLIIVSFSAGSAVSFSGQVSDDVGDFVLEESLKQLDQSTRENALIVNEYFKEYISEVEFLTNFAEDLFNGRVKAEPRRSFYGDLSATSDKSLPPMVYSEKHKLMISTEYSAWYKAHIDSVETDVTDVDMQMVNISSNLDFAWRTIFEQNKAFLWSYMGFANGIHRTYPYKNLTSWRTKEFTNARDGGTITGYDPRIRAFYVNAERAGTLVIPSPQEDPTLGILKISISSPVYYDNGALIGVVGADLTIDTIENLILDVSPGETGYAFIIDSDQNVVFHKELDRSKGVQTIRELEFGQSDSEWEKFSSVASQMAAMKEGRTSFVKDGERWYISYAPIPSAGFSLAIVEKESEILAPSNAIRSGIAGVLFSQILILVVVTVLFVILMTVSINLISKRIVRPIQELTEVTELIAKGNLNSDLDSTNFGSKEITILYDNFRGLLTALRFGNESYYAGNINRAMANYRSALELFKTLGNQKGIGICHNNIGNIYRAQGNLKDANQEYRKAIEIAETLLETASDSEKRELYFALASRYNNLGLLYRDIEQYERAHQYLNKALEYDRMIDNSRGFATRYGNIGTVFLAEGKVEAAKEAFDEAYEIAKSVGSERAVAYATLNYGIYYRHVSNTEEAIKYFLKAIEIADQLDVRVVTSSLKNLKEIYEETGQTELAEEIDLRMKQHLATQTQKEITFVLDYSGSMAGKRIRAAIKGMTNIFKNQINSKDLVSLIVFSNTSKVVIPPVEKEEHAKEFLLKFGKLTRPAGATAFYDAIGNAMEMLQRSGASQEQWIIALTDGDDNSSVKYSYRKLLKLAKEIQGVNLVIIGVGNLESAADLAQLCDLTDKGRYIDVRDGVAETITTAFEEVSTMLTEVEVEGFVPDY